MRKISSSLLSFVLIFALTGCFGSGGLPSDTTAFFNDGFKIISAFPDDWVKINSPVPGDVLIMGYQAKTPSSGEGQFANITIIRSFVPGTITSVEYAKAQVEDLKKRVLGYKQEKYELIKIPGLEGEEETYMHVFTGRSSFETPEVRFIQTYFSSEDGLFTFTATLPLSTSEDEQAGYEDIAGFTGFSATNPSTEEN